MRNPVVEEDLKNITGFTLPWEKFFGKTVLITGASGFIAGYLVETLLYLNELKKGTPVKVVALVRNLAKAKQKFRHYQNRKDLFFLAQDITVPIAYQGKVDYFIHAASFATPSKYGIDPVGTLMPNVLGTYQSLEFARRQRLSGFLFVSSGEVYGNPPATLKRIGEDFFGLVNPVSVRSCYAESKRLGETMCVSWFSQYQVPAKIVRLFHTYGPGMELGDGRVHSDFVANIVSNQNIIMKSEGTAQRPFCYIADTILGFFTILLNGIPGEAYNLGSDQPISIKQLASMLVKICPEKKLKVVMQLADRGKNYLVSPIRSQKPDLAKIKALGWEPKYGLRDGFKRTIDSYIIGL